MLLSSFYLLSSFCFLPSFFVRLSSLFLSFFFLLSLMEGSPPGGDSRSRRYPMRNRCWRRAKPFLSMTTFYRGAGPHPPCICSIDPDRGRFLPLQDEAASEAPYYKTTEIFNRRPGGKRPTSKQCNGLPYVPKRRYAISP